MDALRLTVKRSALSPVTTGTCTLARGAAILFRAHTLELPWLNNARAKSCIPAGTYTARLTMSPRFKRELWLIDGVPNRSGIRIHAANFAHQLHGCIALGMQSVDIDKDGKLDVARSQEAMRAFHQACGTARTMTVTIIDP